MGINEGFIYATMVQQPQKMGEYMIESLVKLNNGETFESVDTGVTVVNKDNIGTFK
jgi:ABC-type sugar transport system substrate-binding protein